MGSEGRRRVVVHVDQQVSIEICHQSQPGGSFSRQFADRSTSRSELVVFLVQPLSRVLQSEFVEQRYSPVFLTDETFVELEEIQSTDINTG